MVKKQQTVKQTQTGNIASLKQNSFTKMSAEYSDYLASYPGAQIGVIMAFLLIAFSITFFLLQNA